MVLLVLVLLLGQEGSVVAHHHAARGRVARVDDADGSVLILLASCTSNDCYKSQNDDDSPVPCSPAMHCWYWATTLGELSFSASMQFLCTAPLGVTTSYC